MELKLKKVGEVVCRILHAAPLSKKKGCFKRQKASEIRTKLAILEIKTVAHVFLLFVLPLVFFIAWFIIFFFDLSIQNYKKYKETNNFTQKPA